MNGVIFHIYGPFNVHSYGLFVALGLATFGFFIKRKIKEIKFISDDFFSSVLLYGCIWAFIGGRLLFMINNFQSIDHWWEIFEFWNGGLSILGSIGAALIALPFYLYYHRVAFFPFFDIVCLYLPLWQSIARIGCFFAGCCYGRETNAPWGISHYFMHEEVYKIVHPTQIYSSLILFALFLVLWKISKLDYKEGLITSVYLFFMGLERFLVDFFRGDRNPINFFFVPFLSINQIIALMILTFALILFLYKAKLFQKA